MALARSMLVVLILWTILGSVQQYSRSALGVFGFMIATTTPGSTIRSSHRFVIPQQQRRLMMSSAPSDSASLDDESDDFSEQGYTATATDDSFSTTTSTPTTTEGIVSKLFDLLPTNGLDQPPDDEMRSTMNELMVQLEKTMTTTSGGFTSSPLLNGVWELRYVGGYTTPTQNNPFRLSPTRQLALFLYDGGYSPGVRFVFICSSFLDAGWSILFAQTYCDPFISFP